MDQDEQQAYDQVVDFFLSLTQTGLPRLVSIFSPGFVEDPERQKLIHVTLDTLIQSARTADFDNLARLFADLRQHLPKIWPMPEADRRRLVTLVAEIRNVAAMLEVDAGGGVYTGSQDLAERLDQRLEGETLLHFQQLIRHLTAMVGTADPRERQRLCLAAADGAAAIWQLLECSGTFAGAPLVLMAADVLHRSTTTRVELANALIDIMIMGINLAAGDYQASRTGEPGPGLDELDAHLQKLRECLRTGRCAGEEDQIPDLLTGIDPGLQETLVAHHLADLAHAREQGLYRYQIMANLEQSPQMAEAFITWLSNHTTVITNRNGMLDDHPCLLFLLVSRLPPDQVAQTLARMDPAGGLVRLLT